MTKSFHNVGHFSTYLVIADKFVDMKLHVVQPVSFRFVVRHPDISVPCCKPWLEPRPFRFYVIRVHTTPRVSLILCVIHLAPQCGLWLFYSRHKCTPLISEYQWILFEWNDRTLQLRYQFHGAYRPLLRHVLVALWSWCSKRTTYTRNCFKKHQLPQRERLSVSERKRDALWNLIITEMTIKTQCLLPTIPWNHWYDS